MPIISLKTGTKSRSLLVGNAAYDPFEPTDIAGCKLWLDAADTASISVSGSAVTQWNDKSGNAYHFTQGTSANRPSSGTRTQNGKNVIDFDGTNDLLTTTAAKSAFNFLHSSTSTIFQVYKLDTTVATQGIMGAQGGSPSQIGYVQFNVGTTEYLSAGAGSGVYVYQITQTIGTTARYNTLKSDPANATAANRALVSLNGAAFTGGNTANSAAVSSDSTSTLSVGDAGTSGGVPLDGFIGEIIIYNSILSAGNITSVQNYLAEKWGI
jgi:hypothetical protein